MPGAFDFLHLKRRSAGSPNELSFDVLEAARNQLDDASQKNAKATKIPGASKGSYHGVAGTSTLSAVPEVERRKKKRRSHALRVRIAATLGILLAVGAVVFVVYGYMQNRADFSSRFDALIAQLTEIDKTLVVADEFMESPLSGTDASTRSQLEKDIPVAQKKLVEALDQIDKTAPYALGNDDTVALTQLVKSVEGRQSMAATALKALELADTYDKEATAAGAAWGMVLDADQTAREATAMANRATTDESTEAAIDLTRKAIDGLTDARYALEAIELRHSKIDFSDQLAYIDKRVEALEHAVETGEAIVAGDREAAIAHNDAYNAADQESVQLAEDLPLALEGIVLKAFEPDMAALQEKYEQGRARVADTDSDIRAYLAR